MRKLLYGLGIVGSLLMMGMVSAAKSPGSIQPTQSLKTARFDETSTLLQDGKVLIVGGMERNGVVLASAELYDPRSGAFTAAGNMHTPRGGNTATRLSDGKVLITGGFDGSFKSLASTELYDPATGAFTVGADMTTPRSEAEAVLLASGKVLIIGGDSVPDETRLASAEIYDPTSGKFTATGSMHVPRSYFAAVRLKDGRVLVVGGASAGSYPDTTIESSAEIFDPATGKFTPTRNMTTRRYKLAATLLADGRVFVVGGSDSRDGRGQYASTEIYDPARGTFTPAGDMHTVRYKLRAGIVSLTDGRVLIASGAGRPELYDPVDGSFTPVPGAGLTGYYFAPVSVLQDGSALIAGGYGADPQAGGVANAWLYQP